jgi:hypothetical protein
MKRLSALALALAFGARAYAGDAPPPDQVVRDIYKADQPSIKGTGLGVMDDKKAMARFFSADLLRKLDADETAAAKRHEPPTIDGDLFADAQEATVDDLKISLVSNDGAKARVLADFDRGGGEREKITYSMILEKGLWRVDDIAYARPSEPANTLRGLLKGK